MQEIREYRRNGEEDVNRLVGAECKKLLEQFRQRREELERRLESGETEKATVIEHRRIGRNDPCPCGTGLKFKKCCGSRLEDSDERIKD